MKTHRRALAALLASTCSFSHTGLAQGGLDAFRDLDLNEYALSTNGYVSSSPYAGVDNFVIVYPAPSTYGPSIEMDETVFVRDGDFGLHTELASGWDVGGLLSIQTLGYGSGQSPELVGMSRRDWTVQGGVMIGRQFGSFRTDVVVQTDLLGEHDGQEYELKLARSFDYGNYYFQPQVDATYQTAKLVDHYFGVTAAEALPDRPEYRPGGGITYGASLEWGWKWHRNWFFTANAGIDLLPSEIRSSPIVDKDYTFSVSVGIAYDAPSLIEASPMRSRSDSGLELKIGAFFANADSKVFLTDGIASTSVNLESDFSLRDAEVSAPFEAVWRINPFHRLELGYFQLQRSGAGDIVVPIDVGDVSFPANELVETSFDTRTLRLGYAFSLLHDEQKELAIFGGAHVTETSYRSSTTGDRVTADTTAILPVLGGEFAVNFTERVSVGAELQLFLSDFNRNSGSLIDFGVFGQYAWRERFSIGAGYRFYRQDIDSADESFFGDYRFEYRGPYVFFSTRI